MSKQANSKISSSVIADIMGIEHRALVERMTQMVTHGTMPVSRLPKNREGDIMYNRAINLSLYDLYMLAHYMPDFRMGTKILSAWKEQSQPSSLAAVADQRAQKVAGVIGQVFKTNIPFLNMVRTVKAGQFPKKAGVLKGFRVEGDDIWIAPSAPHMVMLLEVLGLDSKALSDALLAQPGSYRVPTKKWNGRPARSIGLSVDQFLFAAENN